MSSESTAAVAIDAGALPMGGGLLALVRPALQLLTPGGVLAVNSLRDGLQDDISVWCKIRQHEYLGHEDATGAAESATTRHLTGRGPLPVPQDQREADVKLVPRGGRISAEDVLSAVPMPENADPTSGFAPRGAQVEPGGPRDPFDLLNRDHVVPPEVARLYDQAVESQWDANRDIAWDRLPSHHPDLERALGQVFTFLAENELSALYVPSKFVSRIHPAYAEVAMFLSTQMADEARHIDVFLKRARAGGGGLGVSSATTSQSLLTLLELTDFTEAAFLLSPVAMMPSANCSTKCTTTGSSASNMPASLPNRPALCLNCTRRTSCDAISTRLEWREVLMDRRSRAVPERRKPTEWQTAQCAHEC